MADSSQTRERWAVVGGGILGLTLAHRLAQAGKKVTLIEAADSLGGLASAWHLNLPKRQSKEQIIWDRHYHVTLLSDLKLRSLLKELGLEQDMVWRKTKTGVYADGQLYSVSNAVEFLKFPALGLIDKFRLAFTIWLGSKISNWRRLEKLSVESWLRRWSGDRTFTRFWLPLLRSKLGDNYKKASAAFIWATIYRLYAARRNGLKEEMFGYLPGGYGRIFDRFAEVLRNEGVEIQLGQKARQIYSTLSDRQCIEFADGRQETFDQIVVTTAAPIAADICTELTLDESDRLRGIEYQGIVCASLLLKQPLSNYYVTNITDEGLPFTGVIEMTTLVNSAEFGGHSLVYLPKYIPSNDSVLRLSDEAIQQQFLAGLQRMYPHFHPSDVLDFKISRVKHVMALSTLNYSQGLPPMQTSVTGLHIVNSAHIVNATLNVNDTIALAERALPTLLAARKPAVPLATAIL